MRISDWSSDVCSSDLVESYVRAWTGKVPIVVGPTAYPEFTVERMRALGKIAVAIWGDHAIRAAVTAMQTVFRQILDDGGIHGADRNIVGVEEIFRLQDRKSTRLNSSH